jgi:hypothetical protein
MTVTRNRTAMLGTLMGLAACMSPGPQQVKAQSVHDIQRLPGGPLTEAPPQPGVESPVPDQGEGNRLVRVQAQGFEVLVRAPVDAEVRTTGDGARIEAGGHFAVLIQRGGADVDSRKRAIEQTVGDRLQGFLVDTGEALLYETRATIRGLGGGFHVYAQRPVAGGLFICKSADDLAFGHQEAEAMLTACRSMTVTPER